MKQINTKDRNFFHIFSHFFIVGLIALVWQPSSGFASECAVPEYEAKFDKSSYSETELGDAFKEAHLAYHDYVDCLFENATGTIIPAPDPEETPTYEAKCVPETKIVDIMKEANTVTLMQSALTAYNAYVDQLKELARVADNRLNPEGGGVARDYVRPRTEFQHIIDKEINYSAVALDRSLMSFSEMRTAYLIHLHFQCMQTYLEKYLTVLEDLRGIIMGLPPRIKDASVH